ncbi:MAG: hypothetical protein EWM45_04805 [Rhodopseudomonas palustris]|nr:MAG: hypothetical protein EWM45_04805 [Rhodopseudomonas palustris]
MSAATMPSDEQIAVAQTLVSNILRDVEKEINCPSWLVAYEMVTQGLAELSGCSSSVIREEVAANAFAFVENVLTNRGQKTGTA